MSAPDQQNYDIEDDEDYDHDEEDGADQQITGFPAHESFDVSSFTQSKSGPDLLSRHIKGSFPVSNAPTLQVSPERKLNFYGKNGKNNQKQSSKLGDYKISHDISEASKMSGLEEELEILRRQLKEKEKRQYGFVSKIEQLNNTNLELEQIIRDKEIIIRQKEEQLLLQQKKYKELAQVSNKSASYSSKSKSKAETSYIEEFCPEFLSPQESLELFSQLMVKIDKSTSIKKKILRDRKIIGILSNLMKTQ